MHINFIQSDGFKLDFSSLKEMKLSDIKITRLIVVLVAISILIFMFIFGTIQKIRLGILQGYFTEYQEDLLELKERSHAKGVEGSKTVAKDVILSVIKSKRNWSETISILAKNVPSNVWLKVIRGSLEGGATVEVDGTAKDQQGVSEFVSALNKLDLFSDVALLSSEMSERGEDKEVNFKIKCTYKG